LSCQPRSRRLPRSPRKTDIRRACSSIRQLFRELTILRVLRDRRPTRAIRLTQTGLWTTIARASLPGLSIVLPKSNARTPDATPRKGTRRPTSDGEPSWDAPALPSSASQLWGSRREIDLSRRRWRRSPIGAGGASPATSESMTARGACPRPYPAARLAGSARRSPAAWSGASQNCHRSVVTASRGGLTTTAVARFSLMA
jgi:hypothetical protein